MGKLRIDTGTPPRKGGPNVSHAHFNGGSHVLSYRRRSGKGFTKKNNNTLIMNKAEFLHLYWHDSVIKKIDIDRGNPGQNDSIVFNIEWWTTGIIESLSFKNVYFARFNLNFGVIADECIADTRFIEGEEKNMDGDFLNFKGGWEKYLENINQLVYFEINTASTGSNIKILAKNIYLGTDEITT